MERTIIQGIKRLRVLTPYDYDNMDELVQDLSNALEESSYSRLSPMKVKKGRSWKRRSKSIGNLVALGSSVPKSSAVSEDSESSLDGRIRFRMEHSAYGSQPQSDSDDIKPTRYHQQLTSWRHCTTNMVESDSVNENFHPARQHRRKRKFKRMAVDPQPGVESELRVSPSVPSLMQKNKRIKSLRNMKNKNKLSRFCDADVENVCGASVEEHAGFCGKRKRSIRERSVDCCSGYDERQEFVAGKLMMTSDGSSAWSAQSHFMEYEGVCATKSILEASSSGLSSSESDCGILTNDEGREADDEQSDFFHEPGPDCGIHGMPSWWDEESILSNASNNADPKFEAILAGSFQYMSEAAKQVYHLSVSCLQDHGAGREIRAGRRRLGKTRSPFCVMASMNEKSTKYVLDALQNENACIPHDPSVKSSIGDIKRRRRTPPVAPIFQGLVGESAEPIPESNIGNRMLKSMGWEPGTGLGIKGDGIQFPLLVCARTKNRGLGYGSVPESPHFYQAPPPPPPSPQPYVTSATDDICSLQLLSKHSHQEESSGYDCGTAL